MLGLDTSWYIGSPATARPLLKKPLTSSKCRRRLVRKSATLALLGETSARPGSILCCPSQRKGKEEPSAASIHPHAVPGAASGDEERPRRARARIKPHASSHEPLRKGQ